MLVLLCIIAADVHVFFIYDFFPQLDVHVFYYVCIVQHFEPQVRPFINFLCCYYMSLFNTSVRLTGRLGSTN